MSFYTSLTGLNAATAMLGVTANNISNVGTTGFKRSRADFGDIFATSPLRGEEREEIFLPHAAAFFGCQCFIGGIGSGFNACRRADFFIRSLRGCAQTVVGAQ